MKHKLTLRPDDQIGKSLTAFFQDVGKQYLVRAHDLRLDSNLVTQRYLSEGTGFVTKTLPKFGKHFDACLKHGSFTPTSLFKRGKGVLPSFMQGLTKKVFNTYDGTLLDSPDGNAIRLIRQVCFMFYKLIVDYPQELVNETIRSFSDVDRSLFHNDVITVDNAGTINLAQDLITNLFKDFDHGDIFPRPGPGQTADRICRTKRYEPHVLFKQVHEVYPYYKYFYCGADHLLDSVHRYRMLPREAHGVSRLALVPKDSRGPRIICMEPHEYMWLQQGLGRALMDHMEKHPLTAGHVNFKDQTVNGRLALDSSVTRLYATLDMKEASDRISSSLVDILFDGVPSLKRALLALSTPDIMLPSGELLHKKKFAPMGSALCFPIMSIIHYALGVATLQCDNPGVPRSTLRKSLYVYGDDIIVKTVFAQSLLDNFQHYGLVFNRDKCCVEGFFRESCGVDAFMGTDVTPTRIKYDPREKKCDADVANLVAMANQFFSKGLWSLYKVWRDWIEKRFGTFPCVSPSSAAIGWIVGETMAQDLSVLLPQLPTALPKVLVANQRQWRWDKSTHQPVMKARVIVARPFASAIGGWEQVMRSQLHSLYDSTPFSKRSNVRLRWKRITLSAA